ncbi:MAG TPA: methyltransferase [Burkholderiaceae bacterium]
MDNNDYYNGLNTKLFEAIPPDAANVLELGCANGRLGGLFKSRHPDARWTGVDIADDALAAASRVLDRVLRIDLNTHEIDAAMQAAPFDTVVIGDLLEHLADPGKLLAGLHRITTPDARIVCCLPNMTHVSVIEKMLTGDISYDDMGLLDRTHLKFYSAAAGFKIFLDGGWLPHLAGQYRVEGRDPDVLAGLMHAASALGVPAATALNNLGMYQMVLSCGKRELAQPSAGAPRISVIVPVNREWEYAENIAKSPGLKEIDADIVAVRGATSAADAYAKGRQQCRHDWVLMLHQDVYVPAGAGHELARVLDQLERDGVTSAPIGFAGLGISATNEIAEAGLVIDRTALFRHPVSDDAISLDEYALAFHRDCKASIDPALGWHTWATDLCLQAFGDDTSANARIVAVPLFHNSLNDYTLPASYHTSADTLLAKYPDLERIETLCGTLARSA